MVIEIVFGGKLWHVWLNEEHKGTYKTQHEAKLAAIRLVCDWT